jgi:hypothetical protein
MRDKIIIYEPDIINNQKINNLISLNGSSTSFNKDNPAFKTLIAEGHEDLIKYLEALGLSKDPNLVLLSSKHHYYYDAEEMKNVKTVINLKEINQIKQIKSFLHTMFHILPQKSNFVGCFVDKEKNFGYYFRENLSINNSGNSNNSVENGITSRIPFLNMVYSIMDSKTNRYLSRVTVFSLFDDHGFKVLNMTDINGLTYFLAQKIQASEN